MPQEKKILLLLLLGLNPGPFIASPMLKPLNCPHCPNCSGNPGLALKIAQNFSAKTTESTIWQLEFVRIKPVPPWTQVWAGSKLKKKSCKTCTNLYIYIYIYIYIPFKIPHVKNGCKMPCIVLALNSWAIFKARPGLLLQRTSIPPPPFFFYIFFYWNLFFLSHLEICFYWEQK